MSDLPFTNNNSDLNKKAVKIELFSCTSSAKCDQDFTVVKLELFGNISLILNANDFEHCRKTVYRVKSSYAKRNLSVIKIVKSSFAEHNPPIMQKVELSSAEHNAFISAKLFVIADGNDVELRIDLIIRANRYLFKSVTAVSKYVKTFGFGENYLIIQIQTIENYKTKISIRIIAYAKLAINFFKNDS